MPEEVKDAKAGTEDAPKPTENEVMDGVIDKFEESSASEKGKEEAKAQDPGVDQEKKANLEKAAKAESTPETKLAKIKEILGDDAEAIDAYIKSKGYHTDPAWQKLMEKSKEAPAVDEATQKQLEEFNKVTSSREYIELAMKAKGFTQEAVNAELTKRGFEVKEIKGSDLDLITKQLNIDPSKLDENTRNVISDVARITDILLKDRLNKVLPAALKPLEDGMSKNAQKDNAAQLESKMKNLVKEEGVLDFAKDIEPALGKWIDANKEATQQDAFNEFLRLNHELSVARLKTGKKRVATNEAKKGLQKEGKHTVSLEGAPAKTGDFHKDADSLLDSLGVQ